MKRIDLAQDSQEWLDYKRTRIGGSGAKSILPLTQGADRTPSGFWDLVASRLTSPMEQDEDPRDRGHRLETDCIAELETIIGKKLDSKPTPWVSDEDDGLMLSSDACEPVEVPTYDAEIKSFSSWGKHFKLIHQLNHQDIQGDPLELLNMGYGSDFRYQILHGFVVNPELRTRYFVSYCPEANYDQHKLAIIPFERADYLDRIAELKTIELDTLKRVRAVVSEMIGDDF